MTIVAKLSACALLSQLLWMPPATAQVYWDYKTAYLAYDRGDFELAADMYTRLAADGDVRSQNDLAFMYSVGQGVPRDDRKAAKLYRMAAEGGHTRAQTSLANLYLAGKGVARDEVEAHKWLNLASIVDRNANRRYSASTRRDEIAARLTPAQITRARKRACAWLFSAIKQGNKPWAGRTPSYCGAIPPAPPS